MLHVAVTYVRERVVDLVLRVVEILVEELAQKATNINPYFS